LPESFYKLFADDYKELTIKSEVCFEILYQKLNEYEFVYQLKESIMKRTKIYDNGKLSQTLSDEDWETKLEYLILTKFYNDSYVFIKDLEFQYTKLKKKSMDIEHFYDSFKSSNEEQNLTNDQIAEILNKYFDLERDFIQLESFFNFFNNHKLTFKIKIDSFLKIFLARLEYIIDLLEKEINVYYEMADIKKIGLIFLKDFEFMMKELLKGNDNIWKVVDYYK